MKREIGKWFLDIAKYIVTAVILKELFGGFDEKSIIVTIGTLTALFAFITGIVILNSADIKDNDSKSKSQGAKVNCANNETINSNINIVEAKPKQSNKRKGNRK